MVGKELPGVRVGVVGEKVFGVLPGAGVRDVEEQVAGVGAWIIYLVSQKPSKYLANKELWNSRLIQTS